MNKIADKASPSAIGIYLVAHTNVGKTTLLCTLLGKDVGKIQDAADVTRETMAYDLCVDQCLGALRLWDTPGFSDSFRLSLRLKQKNRCLAWLVREAWDRAFNRKLWQCQRLALHLRARASVILYSVNLQERPFEAVYVAPELHALAWVGKPVLAILNQVGGPHGQAVEADRAMEWRAHLSNFPAVRGILNLDAYTRCWVQELSLFEKIGQVLSGSQGDRYLKLAAILEKTYAERLNDCVVAIADYLLGLATDKVALEAGSFDSIKDMLSAVWGKVSWGMPKGLSPLESAVQDVAQRYAEASKGVADKLIAINRLDGEATAEVMKIANAAPLSDQPLGSGSAAVLGSVMSGILSGLAADLLTGGMTLGTGALVGAVLGATGGAALAKGYNVSTKKDKKLVGWSPAALTEAFEKSLMLYVAVAHFGRGQGNFRPKDEPDAASKATQVAINRYKSRLESLWRSIATEPVSDSAHADCAQLVRDAIRDILLDIHPDFSREHWDKLW